MNFLYYPTIAIPIDELKKYVLYADKISSIVPDDYCFIEDNEDNRLNESITSMSYLEEIGIYEKTYSSNVLISYKDTLIDEFMARIIKEEIYRKVKAGHRPSTWWELYTSKLDNTIKEMLIEEGLAEKSTYNTVIVATEIASIYMGLLAEYASIYGKTFYSTVTNDNYYKELVYKPIIENDRILKLKFSILSILPVPTEDTSLEDIVHFKERRKEELLRFQILITDIQGILAKAQDVREFREVMDKYEKVFCLQLLELESLLKENSISFVGNTIDCFISNSIEDLIEDLTGINVSRGILKLGPVIEKKIFGKKLLIRANPTSYLLSANGDNIINIR